MKATSPVMVQYQHPFVLLGMPPVILICIVFFAMIKGVLAVIFISLPLGFIAFFFFGGCYYLAYINFARGDRQKERVYLAGIFYWWHKKAQYIAGGGK